MHEPQSAIVARAVGNDGLSIGEHNVPASIVNVEKLSSPQGSAAPRPAASTTRSNSTSRRSPGAVSQRPVRKAAFLWRRVASGDANHCDLGVLLPQQTGHAARDRAPADEGEPQRFPTRSAVYHISIHR